MPTIPPPVALPDLWRLLLVVLLLMYLIRSAGSMSGITDCEMASASHILTQVLGVWVAKQAPSCGTARTVSPTLVLLLMYFIRSAGGMSDIIDCYKTSASHNLSRVLGVCMTTHAHNTPSCGTA